MTQRTNSDDAPDTTNRYIMATVIVICMTVILVAGACLFSVGVLIEGWPR